MREEAQFTNTSPFQLPKEESSGVYADPIKIASAQTKYCLYARKSSEDDERQALSIDSQIKEMATLAQAEGLLVTDIRRESHSAKLSGTRPVLNELISDIRKGIFNGILTWAPDRLSRNAGDLGIIVDLMDSGYLKEIKTHSQILTNSPNDKFLLMILCSQAKLENDNRGINVKRGQKAKCERGFRPNMTPIGYLNDYYSGKGQKKIFTDTERAPIIKEMFKKVAYQNYSGRRIYEWLKEINFTTRSGKLLAVSSIFRMLNNPYYCGMFEFPVGSGKWYSGSYEPIISRELFEEVQRRIMVHPKTKPGTKTFDYTKLIKCGSCGSGITAQEKFKKFKNGKVVKYIYYHCTKTRDHHCHEPYTREETITENLIELLSEIPVESIRANMIFSERLKIFEQVADDDSYVQKFLNHIFADGTRNEKRELIKCLNTILYLENNQIVTSKLDSQI
jgi:DNA invertase Pin-like site-specific DNA recombinase